MGNRLGVMKVAALRLGLALQDYEALVAAGRRWCTNCKAWRLARCFGADVSRRDGIATTCLDCRHSPEFRERGRVLAARRRAAKRSRNGCNN